MQTRKGSITESFTNIAVGFSLNWSVNILVLPWLWDPNSPKLSAFYIGCVFTVFSLCRSYILRRWFNGLRWCNRDSAPVSRSFGPYDRSRTETPIPDNQEVQP